MLTARIRRGHERLTEAVRRGGTALGLGTLEAENPDWVEFARAMMPLMSFPAEVMATEPRKGGEARKGMEFSELRWHGTILWRMCMHQTGETFWK